MTYSKNFINWNPITFSKLPGWLEDNHIQALPALLKSCEVFKNMVNDDVVIFEDITVHDFIKAYDGTEKFLDNSSFRNYIEKRFLPFRASTNDYGLFTGYFKPRLRGDRSCHDEFIVPIYRNPRLSKKLSYTREQIIKGALLGNDLEIVWVDDPIEAFFMEIQGSGTIELCDGSVIQLSYDGANGYPYTAIGSELIKKGFLQLENMSMQKICNWLRENKDKANDIMALNKSYVFYKESKQKGAIGTHGVALTAGRSIAVDQKYVPLGVPLWLDIEDPLDYNQRLQRLMLAQDTGGVINGLFRGDFFWGEGNKAVEIAGVMRSKGQYYMLLPKKV